MKPFLAALIAGAIVFLWAYYGAQWDWKDSAVIAAVWAAMAYALTRVFSDPEPGVPKR